MRPKRVDGMDIFRSNGRFDTGSVFKTGGIPIL